MKRLRIALFLIFMSVSHVATASSPFEVKWDDRPVSVHAGGAFETRITIRSPEGHYIYADETGVEFSSLEGIIITDIRFPRKSSYRDPYMGKQVDVFTGDTEIEVFGRVPKRMTPGERELVARVSFRGCSSTLCFRPEERRVSFIIDVTGLAGAEGESIRAPLPSEVSRPQKDLFPSDLLGVKELLKVKDFSLIAHRGMPLALFIVFVAGILTSLTPCVWPVIPIVLLYVGVHPHKKWLKNFLLSICLVSGLVLVYAVLGLMAVVFGKNLGFLFQQRIFLMLVVLFFLAMSLSMFGAFDLKIPRRLQHRLHGMGGEGYWGALMAGMGTGLVASPCAGPVLAALLGHVALQRNYVQGFVLLVIYGAGMSLLFVILGTFYGEFAGKLRGGPWMVWVRRILGIILLFPALFYMGSLFDWGSISSKSSNLNHVEWITNEGNALSLSELTNKPVVMVFSAEWCPPCRALERNFFGRKDIVELSKLLILLKVDATRENSEVRRVIDKYNVVGWPTIIFLNSQGRQFEDLRVNDYDEAAVEYGIKETIKRTSK